MHKSQAARREKNKPPTAIIIILQSMDQLFTVLIFSFLLLNQQCHGNYAFSNFSRACVVPRAADIAQGTQSFVGCATTERAHHNQHLLNFHHDLTEFASKIMDRTIVFIGDSTIENQFKNLCQSFNASLTATNLHAVQRQPYEIRCRLNTGNYSTHVLFLAYGRILSWKESSQATHQKLIKDTTAALTDRDVIVFGVGVHWDYICGTHNKPGIISSIDNFEFAFLTLLDILPLVKVGNNKNACTSAAAAAVAATKSTAVARTGNSSSSNNSNKVSSTSSSPLIIFREQLPQHFATSNGQYPNSAPNVHQKSFSCPALNPRASMGAALASCNPNCLPAAWRNELAMTMLLPYCVENFHIFKHLECLDASAQQIHGKTDCTHYVSPIHLFANYHLLMKIATDVWHH